MRTSRFGLNVNLDSKYHILKSVGIYGSNNVWKTCLLKSIGNIKNVIENKSTGIQSNFFSDSTIVDLEITFLHIGKKYSYDFK